MPKGLKAAQPYKSLDLIRLDISDQFIGQVS